MTHTTRTIAGVLMTLFTVAACNRDKGTDAVADSRVAADSAVAANSGTGTVASDEVDIEGLELGRAVGTDGKITDKTNDFRPADDIVAVVETDDNEAGKELVARWTYGDNDQLVSEQRQTVAAGNEARTTFRLTKQNAWPTGTYHLRILHNGKEVKSEQFTVK